MTATRTLSTFALALLALGLHATSHACDRREPTPPMSQGPHDFSGAPAETSLWREGDGGEPLFLTARVLDTCGRPVAGARVRMLHADEYGDHYPDRYRTELLADDRGEFRVLTVYPGYAGAIPRHIHFIIEHPDHPQLVTRLFFKKDPAVDESIEPLAMVLEEIRREGRTGWMAGFEFVLAPR